MKKFILNVKEDFNNIPNSVKFWNLIVVVTLILTGIFSLELLAALLIIGSTLSIAIISDSNSENHLWIVFMPITWFCLILVGIRFLLYYTYTKTIQRFNNWLDKKEKS